MLFVGFHISYFTYFNTQIVIFEVVFTQILKWCKVLAINCSINFAPRPCQTRRQWMPARGV
jgi:hypothetical protein